MKVLSLVTDEVRIFIRSAAQPFMEVSCQFDRNEGLIRNNDYLPNNSQKIRDKTLKSSCRYNRTQSK
jgi:hypothetical protein